MSTYWQIAAGDKNRNYVDLCLERGVILNGPGHCGRWPTEADLSEEGWSAKKLSDLRTFCESMQAGDRIVLRLGTNEVHGVGICQGEYIWNDHFGDVDGWDLQHSWRVTWIWKAADSPKVFPTYTLNFGATTQRLERSEKTHELFDWLDALGWDSSDLPDDIPTARDYIPTVAADELGLLLFDNGLPSQSLSNVTETIAKLVRLSSWYRQYRDPSEAETVSHLAVPLLAALGWSPQQTVLEHHISGVGRVDIALFSTANPKDDQLSMIVEAKRFGSSVLMASEQAAAYARERPSCDRYVLTDGVRYAVFVRDSDDQFSPQPTAYLNLDRPIAHYPMTGIEGADDALLMMSRHWRRGGEPLRRHPQSTVPTDS